jgi:hypothetical protein
MTTRDRLAEIDPTLLFADGFDEAIIGLSYQWSKEPVVAYDRQKCIDKLMRDGMDLGEAEEFFEFNVQGSWVGEKTPAFITTLKTIDEMLD